MFIILLYVDLVARGTHYMLLVICIRNAFEACHGLFVCVIFVSLF